MIRAAALTALSALLLGAAPAEAPWPTGIYSNVRMSGVTGDLGGMEARFYEDGDRHMVEFVWCEGWCNETFKAPVTREADGFGFSYVETLGSGTDTSKVVVRLLARPKGKALLISAWEGDQPAEEGKPEVLKPAKQLFGIDVANADKD